MNEHCLLKKGIDPGLKFVEFFEVPAVGVVSKIEDTPKGQVCAFDASVGSEVQSNFTAISPICARGLGHLWAFGDLLGHKDASIGSSP